MKKLLAVLLSASMLMGLAAGCSKGSSAPSGDQAKDTGATQKIDLKKIPNATAPHEPFAAVPQEEILKLVPKTEPKGQIIVGDTSEPDQNIMAGFTNISSNAEARRLLSGSATFVFDKDNVLVRNNVVLKDFKRTENPDGTVTYEEEIYPNLKFSDGTNIKASDYVGSVMLYSAKAFEEIDGSAVDGFSIVGYEDFHENNGAKPFTGLRLLGDYKFSVTIKKEEFPNYFEMAMFASYGPGAMASILPGTTVKDDGQGCYFDKPLTKEYLEKVIKDPKTGFLYNYPVSAGAYKFEKYDAANKALILTANKEFLGTFDGWKPQIEKIIIKYADSKTVFDTLANGSIDIASPTGGKTSIEAGKAKVEASNGKLEFRTFDRNGFGYSGFACEKEAGATHFKEVRQAIAYALNRNDFVQKYTGGYGSLVHAQYGLAQNEYRKSKKWLAENLNPYNYDLNKAKEVLEQGGWTLNKDGQPFKEGVDKVRYKMVDGKLMELEIRYGKTDSPVSELLMATLPGDMAKLGINLKITQVDFPKLMAGMYKKDGTPERSTFNFYNLATGYNAIVSYWFSFSDDPKYMKNNLSRIYDPELKKISEAMKATDPTDSKKWLEEWRQLMKRENEVMNQIPLYSDLYHQFYSSKVKNLISDSVVVELPSFNG